MSALEWVLIAEGIVIGIAIIFWVVALIIARNYPEDPIYLFTKAFWMTFLYPVPDTEPKARPEPRKHESASSSKPSSRPSKRRGGRPASAEDEAEEQAEQDAMYGRVKTGADGVIHTANLNVTVLPHSEKDDVLGRTSDGIEVQVTAAAEDGAANKAVIQIVSRALGVKPYQVTLTKGHYHARKTVSISGMEQGELEERLQSIG